MSQLRKLTIVGSAYHVGMITSLVGEHLRANGAREEPSAYYRIGGWLSLRQPDTWIHAMRGDTVVHWIGSDVLSLLARNGCVNQQSLWVSAKRAAQNLLVRRSTHLAGAPWLAEELKSAGVTAEYVPLPVRLPEQPLAPLPRSTSIVCYIPEGREAFYGWNEVAAVARLFPAITWHVVAHSGRGLEAPANVVFHGYLLRQQVLELIERSTAIVRLVDHDGLSYSVLEALALGRYVVWTYAFPYCIHSVKDKGALEQAMREILQLDQPNDAGAEYVHETFDPSQTVRALMHALRKRRSDIA